MFGCKFEMGNGLTHHTGIDFPTEVEAIHYAEKSLEASPNYINAIVTDRGFEILRVEG